MDIDMFQTIIISGSINDLTGNVDVDIPDLILKYSNINNDMIATARNTLETFLFRLYDYKYYVLATSTQVDYKKFVTDASYYNQIIKELEAKLDRQKGLQKYAEAVSYIKAQNYIAAGELFQESALSGDPGGQFNYGVTVSNGEGCEADPLLGAYWYWKSAKNGNPKGMINLAIAYRNGTGVKKNDVLMLYWYASAALLLFPEGVFNLGLCLSRSEVLPGNEEIGRALMYVSRKLYKESSQQHVKRIARDIISDLYNDTLNI